DYLHRKSTITDEQLQGISELTDQIIRTRDFQEFQNILMTHENIISRMMGLKPVGEVLFSDFKGIVKSLEAWGGDFILAAGDDVSSYFRAKGYEVIFSYDELVLS